MLFQADRARKALTELPARKPKRLYDYEAVHAFGERSRLRVSLRWLHSIHGDPITGKTKREFRRELGLLQEEDLTIDADMDERSAAPVDLDMKEFEVDASIDDPVRRGMPLAYLEGLSEIEVSTSSLTVKDDVVVLRWELNGTHSSELFGVAPTQRSVALIGITWLKFDEERKPEGGRRTWATDEWTYWDLPSLMEQIGTTP